MTNPHESLARAAKIQALVLFYETFAIRSGWSLNEASTYRMLARLVSQQSEYVLGRQLSDWTGERKTVSAETKRGLLGRFSEIAIARESVAAREVA